MPSLLRFKSVAFCAAAFFFILSGCSEKDPEPQDLFCTDHLVADPIFTQDVTHYKIENTSFTDSLTSYVHAAILETPFYTHTYNFTWGDVAQDSVYVLFTIYYRTDDNFIDKDEMYEILRPQALPFGEPYKNPPQQYVSALVHADGQTHETKLGDNSDGKFEIIRRSEVYYEGEWSYPYATIDGLFCFAVYNEDSLKTHRIQGNFSAAINLLRQ